MNNQSWKNAYSFLLGLCMLCLITAPAIGQTSDPAEQTVPPPGSTVSDGSSMLLPDPESDATTLPLSEALGVALQNNLTIQIQKVNIPISKESISEKEGRFDPVLYGEAKAENSEEQTSWALAGAEINEHDSRAGTLGVRKLFSVGLEADSYLETARSTNNSDLEGLDPQYRTGFVLSLRQPLLQDFGTKVNTADIRVADNGFIQSKYGFKYQVIQTLYQVEQTYHDLSGALAVYALRKESLRLGEKTFSDNQKRFDAGLIHIGQVQEAETAVASREEILIAARQQARDVTNVLKNEMQLQPSSPLYFQQLKTQGLLPPQEEIPSYEEAFTVALANRPDYAQKQIDIKSNEIMVGYNKNQILPRLDLVGSAGSNGLSGDAQEIFFGDQVGISSFGGGYGDSWDYMFDKEGYHWSIGLTIEIPLGNRTARANYTQSKLIKDQSLMDLKNLHDQINLDVRLALENMISSKDRIRVAQRFVSLAEKTLDQEDQRLKQGLSDTFRIIIFQGALIDAKIRQVQALVDYRKALAQLYQATGTTLDQHNMYLDTPEDTSPE